MNVPVEPFPTPEGRKAWVERLRPDLDATRRALPTDRPAGWIVETEPDGLGGESTVLTVFLTNRECPWRCVMCDLWRHTTLDSVPVGAIPRQIEVALSAAPECRWVKLYNAGSFFDPGAIPVADYPEIARLARGFERVVVECHPSLVGPRILEFREALGDTELEVALGLETANPEVLAKLNKRMTTEEWARAAGFLKRAGIRVRAFVLIQPPFQDPATAETWAIRSAQFALTSGADIVSLIPTRLGNGALEQLAQLGQFAEPRFEVIERAFVGAHALGLGCVFLDLWDLERFAGATPDFEKRRARFAAMNSSQKPVLDASSTDQ